MQIGDKRCSSAKSSRNWAVVLGLLFVGLWSQCPGARAVEAIPERSLAIDALTVDLGPTEAADLLRRKIANPAIISMSEALVHATGRAGTPLADIDIDVHFNPSRGPFWRRVDFTTTLDDHSAGVQYVAWKTQIQAIYGNHVVARSVTTAAVTEVWCHDEEVEVAVIRLPTQARLSYVWAPGQLTQCQGREVSSRPAALYRMAAFELLPSTAATSPAKSEVSTTSTTGFSPAEGSAPPARVVPKITRMPRGSDDISAELDRIVREKSTGWFFNVYERGSISNVFRFRSGSTETVTASFKYTGGGLGGVTVIYTDGKLSSVMFDDQQFPKTVRPPDSLTEYHKVAP